MTVFAILHVPWSAKYTAFAVQSLLDHTQFGPDDQVILIDHNGGYGPVPSPIQYVMAPGALTFGQKANFALRHAMVFGADLWLLSNDVYFTPDWRMAADDCDNVIALPACNQFLTGQSRDGKVVIPPTLSLDDFGPAHRQLADSIAMECAATRCGEEVRRPLMPFYVVRLPSRIYQAVGLFDENFMNGGEDVDYRLRALLAGFECVYRTGTYLVHFHGKSTWDGSEAPETTSKRDSAMLANFRRKWGSVAEHVFLYGDYNAVPGGEGPSLAQACRWRDLLDLTQRHRTA